MAIRSVHELIAGEVGGNVRIRENPLGITASTTDQICLPLNPMRYAWGIVNLGTEAIYIAPNTAATSTRGIRIDITGGLAAFAWKIDLGLVIAEWHLIAASGTPAFFLWTTEGDPGYVGAEV